LFLREEAGKLYLPTSFIFVYEEVIIVFLEQDVVIISHAGNQNISQPQNDTTRLT